MPVDLQDDSDDEGRGAIVNTTVWDDKPLSLSNQAIISFYGPSPARVSAIRVETPPGDPGDSMRGYASIVGTEVYDWVAQRIQTDAVSDETADVGGVWVQTTHDARSDVLLMSTEPLRP